MVLDSLSTESEPNILVGIYNKKINENRGMMSD